MKLWYNKKQGELGDFMVYPIADYHTHTTYSHGTGSVMDSAIFAKQKGIDTIAITDHGFNHGAYAIKRKELPNLRKDIDEAISKTGVNILLGVEANIISKEGDIDIKEEDFKHIQILVMGFHKSAKGKFIDTIGFVLKNVLCGWFKRFSKKQIEINTNAYIKALRKYPIDIISHLGHGCKVNCYEVAKVCEETDTYIELNGKRISFSKQDVEDMLNTNVKFVANSDAHSPDRIGDIALGYKVADMYGIPYDRIVNLKNLIEIKEKRNEF